MPSTTLPQIQLPDPNGFVNALAAGMKMGELRNAGDRRAYKDELATQQRNALSGYLSGDRSPEAARRLAATSPEAALAIEKNQRDVALATARTDTAKAEGEKARLETARQQLEVGAQILSGVRDEGSYLWAKARGQELGLDSSKMPPNYDPGWVEQAKARGLKLKDQLDLQIKQQDYASRDADRSARTGIAQGHLNVAEGNAAETVRHHGALENKGSNGLSITGYDEQGRPLIQMGGTPMGKTAQGEVEKKIIDSTEALARINEIDRSAKPEMLTYGSKLKDAALDVKSKAGFPMSPEQEKFRGDMTDMRQSTMRNLNSTIKEQTGQAISPGEVPRIAATIPTMDDAPDVFARKSKNATRFLRNTIIRAEIARAQGMDPINSGIDLADTKKLMNLREQQLRQQYGQRAPGMKPDEADAAIEKQLREEFGY